ncbi:hypothetical protein AAC387_Pa01g0856 [Persea americana]
MASLLSPAASTSLLQKLPFPPKPTSPNYPSNLPRTPTPPRCNAFPVSQEILNTTVHLDDSMALFPFLQSGFFQFNQIAEEFPELQRWEVLTIVGLGCVYLTARPGVLMGAIDTYLLAPLQVGLDSFAGRRSSKRTDFVVGDRLGEGSFGIVYSAAIVPKNASVEDEPVRKKGRRVEIDGRFKQKVILKKVKVLKNVEILRSGLTTGSQGQLLKHVLSSLEVLSLTRPIHNLPKVENGLSGNLREIKTWLIT